MTKDEEEVEKKKEPKPLQTRVAECVHMRGRLAHTDVARLPGNERAIREAMNAFVRDGCSATLKLWCDADRRGARAIVTLTSNPDKASGITVEMP